MGMTIDQIQSWVNQYAPVVYLNSNEVYLPASIDWYLPLVTLVDGNNSTNAPSQLDIANASKAAYLSINPASNPSPTTEFGNPSTAPFYVRFTQVGASAYDIEYWFFYAFNGCSSLSAEVELGSKRICFKDLQIPPFGEHQGDWERTTVRIDVDATTQSAIVAGVYMAQHGGGSWFSPGDYQVYPNTDRPIVYSAFHSHASYPSPGQEVIKTIDIGPHDAKLKFGLFDSTTLGSTWDPLATGGAGALVASVQAPGVTDPNQPWVSFPGHWGPPTDKNTIVDAATEVIYHAYKSAGGPDSHLVKDGIKDLLGELFGTILPGGPLNPSQTGVWNGEKGAPSLTASVA